MNFRSS